MKRRAILRFASVVCCVVLVALLALPMQPAAPADAAAAPRVTVYLRNYLEEYNLGTAEFLAAQFDNPDSPAYGVVSYTTVTTLTQASLNGSVALIIDESADMSLTAADAALIHTFVGNGGRVGLFAFPRYYWDHVGTNPAAFQLVSDLFGGAVIGVPDEIELESGTSSAQVTLAACVSGLCFTSPYSVTGALVRNFDHAPFTPISSTGTTAILTSAAFDGMAVAVANSHGLLVTSPIGDMVQGGDANQAYRQFVTDAIVWLANGGMLLPNKVFLPIVRRLAP